MIRATTLAVTIAALSTFVTTIACGGGEEPAPAPEAAAKPAPPTKAEKVQEVTAAKASKASPGTTHSSSSSSGMSE